MRTHSPLRFVHALALTTLFMACDTASQSAGADAAEAEEDPSAEACEHGSEGPFKPVTANDTAPPDTTATHTAWQITLSPTGRSVSFASGAQASYRFFVSKDLPLSIATAAGAPVDAVTRTAETTCAEVVASFTAELGVGTYHLTFGAGADAEVTLVVEKLED